MPRVSTPPFPGELATFATKFREVLKNKAAFKFRKRPLFCFYCRPSLFAQKTKSSVHYISISNVTAGSSEVSEAFSPLAFTLRNFFGSRSSKTSTTRVLRKHETPKLFFLHLNGPIVILLLVIPNLGNLQSMSTCSSTHAHQKNKAASPIRKAACVCFGCHLRSGRYKKPASECSKAGLMFKVAN